MTKTTKSAANSASQSHPRKGSKIAAVIGLLERKQGATLDELTSATGWLPHSARAALTGLRKKGHDVARKTRGDLSCYHIAKGA